MASLLAVTLLLFNLTACQGRAANETTTTLPDGLQRYNSRFLGVFDTVSSLVGLARSEEEFTTYSDLVQAELERLHQLFDTFKAYEGINNLKTVNDNAGIKAVEVDPDVIRLMDQAIAANQRTKGKVNMSFGPVLEIWHDYREFGINNPEEASLPDLADLEAANEHTDITKVVIDREAGTIYLPDPEMSLDVGSGAKGLAVELASQKAIEAGLTDFLLSVGGNVRASGYRDAAAQTWRVGIQDPDGGEEDYIDIVYVTDMAVVTSGVYERFYTVDGQRYHHIIHPDTLFPAYNFDSVSIVAPDSGLADSLTTALFNMPLEEGQAMIESLDGVAALWVKDGEVTYSSRMEALLNP